MGPTNKELSIIMRLRDEATKQIATVQGQLVRFSNDVQSAGQKMQAFGRGLSQIGQQAVFVGAALTGPLALAFRNAASYSEEVRTQMERMQTVARNFQLEIAQAMVPVVERLVNVLANLANWFSNLSPQMREAVVQWGLMAGVALTLSGTVGVLLGKLFQMGGVVVQLVGSMIGFAAANPVLLAVLAAVVGIVSAMMKWKTVADIVMNTFQVLFDFLANGFDTVLAGLQTFVAYALDGVATVLDALGKIPGPQREALQRTEENLRNVAAGARELADDALQRVVERSQEIGAILTGENGSWAEGFATVKDDLLAQFEASKAGLSSLGTVNQEAANRAKKGWVDFKKELPTLLSTLQSTLEQAGILNKGFARVSAAIAISMAIVNTAQGVTRALKDYMWPFSMVVAGIIAATGAIQIATIASQKFHQGGVVRAHDGLAVDEVPIIAQRGEGILSRRGMAALGGVSPFNALNAGISAGRGGEAPIINIGPIYMQPQENIQEFAERLADITRRQRRYYGLT